MGEDVAGSRGRACSCLPPPHPPQLPCTHPPSSLQVQEAKEAVQLPDWLTSVHPSHNHTHWC